MAMASDGLHLNSVALSGVVLPVSLKCEAVRLKTFRDIVVEVPETTPSHCD
jgi:hypothetical protein